jgi:hypothetical protein
MTSPALASVLSALLLAIVTGFSVGAEVSTVTLDPLVVAITVVPLLPAKSAKSIIMAAVPSVVPAATVSVAVQLVAEEILLTDEADAPAIVTVGVAMASLEVKVIVMTSVSFASVVVELLLAMVTGDNVGRVVSKVTAATLF